MSQQTLRHFSLATPRLRLAAREVPWDTAIYGVPVVQVHELELLNPQGAMADHAAFQDWLVGENIGIVSARLGHERLRESMLLEANGYRFIEMVLHPRLDGLQKLEIPADTLEITPATGEDLRGIADIAEHAFGYERYHVDPRLDPRLADQRYGYWVRTSLHHPAQRLLKVVDTDRLIGFFVVENQADLSVYWHLTAIAPPWQGRGYGRRAWLAMLRHHQDEGAESVITTISARNTRILNLYAQLKFRFMPPEMTFHWVREPL